MRTTQGPTRAAALLLAALALPVCSGEESGRDAGAGGASPPSAAEEVRDPARLARQGEQVYRSVCIACHAFDPSQAGSVGPAIAGSSLELLRAKVLRNEYPPGYTPKRDTSAMVALPHLEPDLPALAAYLQAAEEGQASEGPGGTTALPAPTTRLGSSDPRLRAYALFTSRPIR